MDSKLKFTEIDYRTAGIYLAIKLGPEGLRNAGLEGLTPTKLTNKGRPPGASNWEVTADTVSSEARRREEREAEE